MTAPQITAQQIYPGGLKPFDRRHWSKPHPQNASRDEKQL